MYTMFSQVIHTLLFCYAGGELPGYLSTWGAGPFLNFLGVHTACLDMDFDMVLNKDAANFDYW